MKEATFGLLGSMLLVGVAGARSVQEADAWLHGRLVLEDGSPAASVPVRLHGWEANVERVNRYGSPAWWRDVETTSAADGSFSLRFVPPRAYQFTLDAKKDGLVAASWRWSGILAGEEKDLGDIELAVGGTVTGRILDRHGLAILSGWRVHADGPDGEWEGRDAVRESSYLDPLTGTFVIRDLPAGPVELSAHSSIANRVYGPPILVVAGETVEVDLRYEGPDPARRIVVVPFSRPFYTYDVAAEDIVLTDSRGETRSSYRIEGSAGSFAFDDLEAGSYTASIVDPRFHPWQQTGVVPGTRLNAHLRGNSAVALSVFSPEGRVAAYGLVVRLENGSYPNEFRLSEATEPEPAGGLFTGFLPDACTLIVEVPAYATVEHRLDRLTANETRSVTVHVQKGGGVVGTVVLSDQASPARGVTVIWMPAEKDAEPPRGWWHAEEAIGGRGTTDGSGRIEFDGLAPGAYVLKAYAEGSVPVEAPFKIRAAETTRVRLVLAATTTLSGKLVVPEGASLDGYDLGAYAIEEDDHEEEHAERGIPDFIEARLDADGSYQVGPIEVGRTIVLVLRLPPRVETAPDGSVWHSNRDGVTIARYLVPSAPDVRRDFDVRDRFPGKVRVRVRLDGKPARGLRVFFNEADFGGEFESADLDENGSALVEPLRAENWLVFVGDPETRWAWARPEPIAVRAGRTVECELDVRLYAGSLRILDAESGSPLAERTVVFRGPLVEGEPIGSPTGQTNAEGELEIALPPGTYHVQDVNDGHAFEPDRAISVELKWTDEGPETQELELQKCRIPTEEELRERDG